MSLQYAFEERTSFKIKKPKRYQVIMLNDDFTPMDFVVEILRTIFHKEETDYQREIIISYENEINKIYDSLEVDIDILILN